MLKIHVNVDVAESIRRGKASPSSRVISISDEQLAGLSEEQRKLLADNLQNNHRDDRYDMSFQYTIKEPTLEGILERAKEVFEERKVEAEKNKIRREQENREAREKTLAVLKEKKLTNQTKYKYDKFDGERIEVTYNELSVAWPYSRDVEIVNSPEALAFQAEVDAANATARKNAEDKFWELVEEHKKQNELSKQERLSWIEAHGSERLKRMVKEGIEHRATYRDERLAKERPSWKFSDEDFDEPRNPPEEAFDMLDKARKEEPDAQLGYYVTKDEYEDEKTGHYVAFSEFLGKQIVFEG